MDPSESATAVPNGSGCLDDVGLPVLMPTCHDVLVDHCFEIFDTLGSKNFTDLLYWLSPEILAVAVSKEALSIAGKVLRLWKANKPPGRFLERPRAEGSWVVASFRTSLRVTLLCFKALRTTGFIKVVSVTNPGVEVRAALLE
jgi:hypothetical protein